MSDTFEPDDPLDEPTDPDEDEQPTPGPIAKRPKPELVDDRDPWEKQPGESRQAFHAFALYRDLGPYRSAAKVSKETGKDLTLMTRWSARWRWVERTEAYDLMLDRRNREARESEQDRANRRQAALAALMQGKVMQRLRGDEKEQIAPLDLNGTTLGELAATARVATTIERAALGMATDAVRGATSVPASEVGRIARLLVEAALEHIDDEARQDLFLLRVEEIGRTGR